jgi:hypothetical protein
VALVSVMAVVVTHTPHPNLVLTHILNMLGGSDRRGPGGVRRVFSPTQQPPQFNAQPTSPFRTPYQDRQRNRTPGSAARAPQYGRPFSAGRGYGTPQ